MLSKAHMTYGWELVAVCHQTGKFRDYRPFDSGYLMFLICHMTSRDQVFK